MQGFLNRFLSFDKMIAGTIIKFIYYIGMALIVIGGLFQTVTAPFNDNAAGLIIYPLATIVILVFWRIWCELIIVMFRISDNLAAVRKHMDDRNTAAAQ